MNKTDAGRGMMVYVSNTLKYTVVELDCNFEEYISVEIILNKMDKLLFTSIYRSPNSCRDN